MISSHLRKGSFEEGQIIRKSFGLKNEIREDLLEHYHSSIIEKITLNDHTLKAGRVCFRLAKSFGFCYGVDRAVDMAYETRQRFPDRQIYLTAEIIHNPTVNKNLENMGVRFLKEDFSVVKKEDVVILPAFGATASQIEELKKKGCVLVDTICGSVLTVWKRVEAYSHDGFTSIIHGKYYHEETQATSSRVQAYPNGKYLVVLNMEETRSLCDYLLHGGEKEKFIERFGKQMSPGFDPDHDLKKIGLANQTTMLMSESLEIAKVIREVMVKKIGERAVSESFRSFDTICSATEDRQNAVREMIQENPDVLIVVGGYNSSNTNHLAKLGASFCQTFHIEGVHEILSHTEIRSKKIGSFETVITKDWLPSGNITIGLTSGASTPNQVLGKVVEKIIQFA